MNTVFGPTEPLENEMVLFLDYPTAERPSTNHGPLCVDCRDCEVDLKGQFCEYCSYWAMGGEELADRWLRPLPA